MKITVVTVCFNAVNEIEETMLSVLGQTYTDIEYIVIDGGSTDGTVDIIKKYADRLAYWVSEPDKGIFDAMNKGISYATGEYINFMNAGDRFYSSKVISSFFSNRKSYPDFIAGIAVLNKKSFLPHIWEPIRENFKLEEVINGGACNHQSCFIKHEVIADGYAPEYGLIADNLFFLEKVAFGKSSYERNLKPVAIYNTCGFSNQTAKKAEMNSCHSRFLSKYLSPKQIDCLKQKFIDGILSAKLSRRIQRFWYRLILIFQ